MHLSLFLQNGQVYLAEFLWSISRILMVNVIKMKKIYNRIRSQWPFVNLHQPQQNLLKPGI